MVGSVAPWKIAWHAWHPGRWRLGTVVILVRPAPWVILPQLKTGEEQVFAHPPGLMRPGISVRRLGIAASVVPGPPYRNHLPIPARTLAVDLRISLAHA